jgi:hypothetical protein
MQWLKFVYTRIDTNSSQYPTRVYTDGRRAWDFNQGYAVIYRQSGVGHSNSSSFFQEVRRDRVYRVCVEKKNNYRFKKLITYLK